MDTACIEQSVTCARRGRKAKDVTGQRFGRLTALYRLEKKSGSSYMWRCRCDCGKETDVRLSSLISGNTKSCGCKREDSDPPALRFVDGTCIERIDKDIICANNTSGYTGVVPLRDGRWRAEITFRGKRQYLGTYSDIHVAAEVRRKAEQRLFGEFLDGYYANTNEAQSNQGISEAQAG